MTPQIVDLDSLLNDFDATTDPDGFSRSTLSSGGFKPPPPSRSVSPVTPTWIVRYPALKSDIVKVNVLLPFTGMLIGRPLDGFGLPVSSTCCGTVRTAV